MNLEKKEMVGCERLELSTDGLRVRTNVNRS